MTTSLVWHLSCFSFKLEFWPQFLAAFACTNSEEMKKISRERQRQRQK